MKKRNKKVLSFLLTLSLLVVLLVPWAATAATGYTSLSVPSVGDGDWFQLGTVISETPADALENGSAVIFSLPGGFAFAPDSAVFGAGDASKDGYELLMTVGGDVYTYTRISAPDTVGGIDNSLSDRVAAGAKFDVEWIAENQIKVSVNYNYDISHGEKAFLKIEMLGAYVAEGFGGDIKLVADAPSGSGFPSGEVVVGKAPISPPSGGGGGGGGGSGGAEYTILAQPAVDDGGWFQLGTVIIKVDAEALAYGGAVVFSLPDGFAFAPEGAAFGLWDAVKNGYGLQKAVGSDVYTYTRISAPDTVEGIENSLSDRVVAGAKFDVYWLDENEIIVSVSDNYDISHGEKAFLKIEMLDVYIAEGFSGDIKLTAEAPSGSGFPSGEVVVGTAVDDVVAVAVIEDETSSDDFRVTLRIKENHAGALLNEPDSIKMTLPEGFSWTTDNGVVAAENLMMIWGSNMEGNITLNKDGNILEIGVAEKTTSSTCFEITLTFLAFDDSLATAGDIMCTLSGSSNATPENLIVGLRTTNLDKPAKPVLAKKTVTWTKVANENNGYRLQLYKGEVSVGEAVYIEYGAPSSYDFSGEMAVAGSYTVTVTARGTGQYTDSPESEHSAPQVVAGAGGETGQVQLPAGTTEIALGEGSAVDLSGGVQTASGGQINVGGQNQDLSSFTSGNLNSVNLSVPQMVGGKPVTVGKGVLFESGADGQPVTITNNDVTGVTATIPDGTTVLAPIGWDGTIEPPKVVTAAGNAPSGFSVGNVVIEVGSPDAVLLFDKPVTLLLEGVTGTVGYKPAGSDTWVQITTEAGGTYDNPTPPAFPGEAYKSNGTDTKIITWHFTTFANMVEQPAPPPSGGGGGGGGSLTPPTVNSTTGSALVYPAAGGKVGLGSDAVVDIPARALGGNSALNVTVQKVDSPPAAPTGFMLAGSVFEFTVDNKVNYAFNKPVNLTLAFDPAAVPQGSIPAIYYFDASGSQWVKLGGKVSGSTIMVNVDHFTKFAIIIEKAPEKPAAALKDISGHWAQGNISQLVKLGAISGYPGGYFRPDGKITRAEFAAVLVKAFNLQQQGGKVYGDTSGHWAKDFISMATAHGIASGYSETSFGPDDPITREQMAVMITKAAGLDTVREKSPFLDCGHISDWARDAVTMAAKKQIMKGFPDGTFQPRRIATRAEAVTVIYNALKQI